MEKAFSIIYGRSALVCVTQSSLCPKSLDTASLSLYCNTHVGNCFTCLCKQCTGCDSNLVVASCCSGTSDAVVRWFDLHVC